MSLPEHVDAELLNLDPIRESLAALPQVDVPRMRQDRLDRLQADLQQRDLGGILLYDPIRAEQGHTLFRVACMTLRSDRSISTLKCVSRGYGLF